MSAKYNNVIVFGPTGSVGANVALEASKRGAKVWLAMRSTKKTIAEIPADVEKSGNFARVQADLSDPATVAKAVKESGAKAAYIYRVQTPDGLRGSLQAMKDAGIEYIVFLSSFSIERGWDLRSITKEEAIPYSHAEIEIAIEDLGFPYTTALRPGAFASNHFKIYLDSSVKPPRAIVMYEDATFDNITPEDIGAVGGATLVDRPSNGKEIIYLCGPERKKTNECWAIIKKITGRKDIDTNPVSEEDLLQTLVKRNGLPISFAKYLVRNMETTTHPEDIYPDSMYKPAVANIKKYLGREAMKFEDYIEKHKEEWQAV